MHKKPGQRRVPVGNFDRLDARPMHQSGGFLKDAHRLGVDIHAVLRARLDEALAGLIVAGGAHETRSRRELVACAQRFAAAGLDLVAHPGPFLNQAVSSPTLPASARPTRLTSSISIPTQGAPDRQIKSPIDQR